MIQVSEAFLQATSDDVIHPTSYIVLGDECIVPVSYQLQDAVYDEDSQSFLGTFISRYGEMVLFAEHELSLQDEKFQLYTGFQHREHSIFTRFRRSCTTFRKQYGLRMQGSSLINHCSGRYHIH